MDRETEQRRLKEMERNGMKAGLWKVRWRERDGEGEVERGRERERKQTDAEEKIFRCSMITNKEKGQVKREEGRK